MKAASTRRQSSISPPHRGTNRLRSPGTTARATASLAVAKAEAEVPRYTGRLLRPSAQIVEQVMRTLAREIDGMELPAVEKISEEYKEDPFQILIGTILSARTQDATTDAASRRLFRVARTPRTMAALPVKQIEKLIYPVSFYRNKARFLKATCEALVQRFGGKVPGTLEELLTLPGVGRKTANLVLILGFQSVKNICVDTHVHRISNRLGWVRTREPNETEQVLYRATDQRWWPYINLYLVTWGQNVCRPLYPRCNACALATVCPKIGTRKPERSRRHVNTKTRKVPHGNTETRKVRGNTKTRTMLREITTTRNVG